VETALAVVVVIVFGGLFLWAQFGALFERRYRRDDPGITGRETDRPER
jgi:hypothetical protein